MATVFVTDRCMAHGHPEVTVTFVEPPLIPGGERLVLGPVETAVAAGTRFSVGQTLAVGGHVVRFCQRDDGTLGVEEPVPSPKKEWVEAIDRTVREVMLQRFACESVGLEPVFPPPQSSLLVARCGQDAAAATLTRVDAGDLAKGLSGWSLACAEDHDHGDRFMLPTLALSALKPELVAFLALPPETVVLVTNGPATVFFQGQERKAFEGSYLARWNARRARPTDS